MAYLGRPLVSRVVRERREERIAGQVRQLTRLDAAVVVGEEAFLGRRERLPQAVRPDQRVAAEQGVLRRTRSRSRA